MVFEGVGVLSVSQKMYFFPEPKMCLRGHVFARNESLRMCSAALMAGFTGSRDDHTREMFSRSTPQ